MALLELDGLSKSFGGVTAVDDASFAVEPGEILGLAGPNGAGKTVTFNLVTGRLTPDAGRVRFDGEDITGARPDAVADAGIGRTFQQVRVYDELSVRENLLFAAQDKGVGATVRAAAGAAGGAESDPEAVAEPPETVELAGLADAPASALSYGQRKLLSFAAALLTHPEPELIMLDEPMAGVNPALADRLVEYVREFRAAGKTFLLVEHDVRLMSELCDRLVVMDAGRPIASGPPAEVRTDDRVVEAYFGS